MTISDVSPEFSDTTGSGICFVGLTVNNVALFIDLVVYPTIDLRLMRLIPALIGMFLLYGFIWDAE